MSPADSGAERAFVRVRGPETVCSLTKGAETTVRFRTAKKPRIQALGGCGAVRNADGEEAEGALPWYSLGLGIVSRGGLGEFFHYGVSSLRSGPCSPEKSLPNQLVPVGSSP